MDLSGISVDLQDNTKDIENNVENNVIETDIEKLSVDDSSQMSQDSEQKMNVLITLIFEVYRVLMGSMLVLFVPQDCNGSICTIQDNFNRDDSGLTKSAFALNLLTMLAFIVLYKIEVSREHLLIDNLDVNPNEERTNEKVGENIEKLDLEIKNKIWKYDDYYKNTGYTCMGIFSLNSILSSVVIFNHYLNDKTITVLLTNLLFMGLKINEVFTIVYTEKNIFLSAFLTRKVQFNDIDKDKLN